MDSLELKFKDVVKQNSKDQRLRTTLKKATTHSLTKRAEVVAELPNWEDLRMRGFEIRKKTMENIATYLEELEENLISKGIEVVWAKNTREACWHVSEILRQEKVQHVVKSKSMVTEEIELNDFLKKRGYEIIETDLGEYIVQLAEEKPSHITAPALHKSKEEIGKLFEQKLGINYTTDPSELTQHVRKLLREKFIKADAGISGANFLVAESGTIVIIENEGNACLSTSLPNLHIVVTGIEKVIPTLDELGVMLKLLPRSATGQRMTSYVSLINSPRRFEELDVPKRIVVVLIDNGRSKLFNDSLMLESLYCIRCGACMNVCPIYQTIGGHAYGSTYPGPIGSVISPLLDSIDKYKDLFYASSLCGACYEICPVKINIPHLLLLLRSRAVKIGLGKIIEKFVFRIWQVIMVKNKLYRLLSKLVRLIICRRIYIPIWSRGRDNPLIAKETFSEWWRKNVR